MQFIDSHAHLTDPAFDTDRTHLLSTVLPQAGLIHSMEIGCAPEEWQTALTLAEAYPALVHTVLGVHPEYARSFSPTQQTRLTALLAQPQAVAVGETGLDYTCLDLAGKDDQHRIFAQQISLADQTALPLVLHVRRNGEDYSVYDDTFALLTHSWARRSRTHYPGVLHCFCARYEEAKKAVDLGLLLGINGCFTYKKNEYIRQAVKKIGLEHVVLETDCPYLSPQGKRGTRNDPSNIPLIAQWLADYLDEPVERVAEQTTLHTKKLYGLP